MATPPDFSVGQVLTAAQMNAVGMWKVASGSFSNTTTIVADNVFTNNFDHYKLLVSLRPNSTATGGTELQLRAGGANLAGSSYVWQGYSQNVANNPGPNNGSGTSGWYLSNFYSATDGFVIIESTIFNPQNTAVTGFFNTTSFDWPGPTYYTRTANGFYTPTTSADGFRIIPTAAITGSYKLYGFRD